MIGPFLYYKSNRSLPGAVIKDALNGDLGIIVFVTVLGISIFASEYLLRDSSRVVLFCLLSYGTITGSIIVVEIVSSLYTYFKQHSAAIGE